MTNARLRVLAGDIGGTKTRLGIFEGDAGHQRSVEERDFACSRYTSLAEIVAEFLGSGEHELAAACFGIAGPVTGRCVRLTNLQWVVDADDLERETGIPSCALINDLEATAWGVSKLGEGETKMLNAGRPDARGNGAVIAAGTGLGEAGIYWDGERMHPFACEGGHASFSPTNRLGDKLLSFLRGSFETVSWERVLSGPGLADLYRFMLLQSGQPAPRWFVDAEGDGDPVPAIASAGLQGRCEVSKRTLDIFAFLYGEEAANLALKLGAFGGVWVGGGIAPKILPVLEGGAFMSGFLAKGRMRPLLESIPVHVVLDDRAALLGAAHRAASLGR